MQKEMLSLKEIFINTFRKFREALTTIFGIYFKTKELSNNLKQNKNTNF